jgi:hypothetical protein
MLPLSYNGFGPAAILLMLACLVIAQLFRYFRHH